MEICLQEKSVSRHHTNVHIFLYIWNICNMLSINNIICLCGYRKQHSYRKTSDNTSHAISLIPQRKTRLHCDDCPWGHFSVHLHKQMSVFSCIYSLFFSLHKEDYINILWLGLLYTSFIFDSLPFFFSAGEYSTLSCNLLFCRWEMFRLFPLFCHYKQHHSESLWWEFPSLWSRFQDVELWGQK